MASCAAPPPWPTAIEEAATTFVGTVVATTNGERWAEVEVEEVWRGEAVPDEVEVRAGPKDPPGPMTVATSTDRSFKEGEKYLFLPHARNGEIFRDSDCSRTTGGCSCI